MDIIICENCEEENEYGAKVCKKCGHELYYQKELEEINENNNEVEDENYDDYELDSILINLSVEQAVDLIEKGKLGVSFVIREIRNIRFSENKNCVVIVAEKYFYMVKGYVSVTIIIDNAGENTRIQICASGGGEGIIGFEYGREDKFENEIIDIFEKYIIQ